MRISRNRIVLSFCCGLLVLGPGTFLAADEDQPAFAATGFFHAVRVGRGWELVDPEGKPFFSTAVDAVSDPPRNIFGGKEAFRSVAAHNLMSWNFDTVGPWSDYDIVGVEVGGRHLAYTPILNIASRYVAKTMPGRQAWGEGIMPDVFDPEFEIYCQQLVEEMNLGSFKNDPYLLGWYTDNELGWGLGWRSADEQLIKFLNLPRNAPGRNAALNLLRQRYPNIADFDLAWGKDFTSWEGVADAEKFVTPSYARNNNGNSAAPSAAAQAFKSDCNAFAGLMADRYFQITARAIRSVDPNHMIIGCRFAFYPPPAVIDSAGRNLDIISFNCYGGDLADELAVYSRQGKPLIIGEFSFRGIDSGLPNTQGAGPLVATQADRAAGFENYVRVALKNPSLVGYQWFKYRDEPRQGRALDGENSNNGVVNIMDMPYGVLADKMTQINGQALALHQQVLVPAPVESPVVQPSSGEQSSTNPAP